MQQSPRVHASDDHRLIGKRHTDHRTEPRTARTPASQHRQLMAQQDDLEF